MRRSRSRESIAVRTVMLFLLLAGAPALLSAATPCTGDGPTAVLACYVAAYEGRDLSALESLLASDYEFVRFEGEKETERMSLADELAGSKRFFEDASVRGIHVKLGDAVVTPVAKPTRGTAEWRLSGIHSVLSVEVEKDEKLETYTVDNGDVWLFARALATPEPHFEIFRAEIHEAAGK